MRDVFLLAYLYGIAIGLSLGYHLAKPKRHLYPAYIKAKKPKL